MLATQSKPAELTEKDFYPPLKRSRCIVPGYWTIEEIANELEVTTRRVRYDVTGLSSRNIKPNLDAYQIGRFFLISDENALDYIQRFRNRKKAKEISQK
jgi:transcriptional antiterminator